MRTTKRFTPKVLARFEREGRGQGTYADYLPHHRVSRGDPASSGRSHLLMFRGRLRERLSDGELHEELFSSMLSDLDDGLEQYPLSLESSPHVLSEYGERPTTELYPGTLQIAEELGIKHPVVSDKNETAWWKLSTDHVLIRRNARGRRGVLPVSFKPDGAILTKRQWQLLRLEREFWLRRKCEWLLITSQLFERSVALTLRRIAPWGLGPVAPSEAIDAAVRTVRAAPYASFTRTLDQLSLITGDYELAQNAIWQAVWTGALPIDLRRGWRPHVPLQIVSDPTFWAFNPVASGRTAWT